MSKGAQTRQRMIDTATRIFQAQGYAATGLKQILKESGAPRGSLYFHFPDGKEQLAAAVIAQHAERFAAGLEAAIAGAPRALGAAEMAIAMLAQQVEHSSCESGCPVSVIALEMANRSAPLRAASEEAYTRWRQLVSQRLVAEGMAAEEAERRASVLLAAIEGALIMCRAYQNASPLRDVAASLPSLLA